MSDTYVSYNREVFYVHTAEQRGAYGPFTDRRRVNLHLAPTLAVDWDRPRDVNDVRTWPTIAVVLHSDHPRLRTPHLNGATHE